MRVSGIRLRVVGKNRRRDRRVETSQGRGGSDLLRNMRHLWRDKSPDHVWTSRPEGGAVIRTGGTQSPWRKEMISHSGGVRGGLASSRGHATLDGHYLLRVPIGPFRFAVYSS
jgi:hypothetical protein